MYLYYGFGFGGPCFPRDNRAFAAYAEKIGVQTPLGATTDKFNDEHTRFLGLHYVQLNKQKLPYSFKYLTYKEGVDILTESRPYDLAMFLLNSGYKVYCTDVSLEGKIDSRIIFDTPTEEVINIDL